MVFEWFAVIFYGVCVLSALQFDQGWTVLTTAFLIWCILAIPVAAIVGLIFASIDGLRFFIGNLSQPR